MCAEPGEAEDLPIRVPDRKRHARAEVTVDTPTHGTRREARGHDVLTRVAEPTQVAHQQVGTNRRPAHAEGPDHLLVKTQVGERDAGATGGPRVPEVGLEEFASIGKQPLEAALRTLPGLDLLCCFDGGMLPDGP